MSVKQGFSDDPVSRDAVCALKEQIWQEDIALVVFFASPDYDRYSLEQALAIEFANVQVIGCTTAGEITGDGYKEGTLTGMSFSAKHFAVHSVLVEKLRDFRMEQGEQIARNSLDGLGFHLPTAKSTPAQTFAMLLVDGLSNQEEVVVSSINRFLDPIPLFGGSAGDGLKFGTTWVYHGRQFHADAAVLTLFNTSCAFKVFKLDHFTPTDQKMVVTEADTNSRRVMEINAEVAAPAYAKMVGLEAQELSPLVFAAYPVVVKIGGEYHVRAIQKVEDDGSLRFYCGIDEGLVLTVARGDNIAANLAQNLTALTQQIGEVELILGFDCILRRLEAEQKQQTREVSEILKQNRVIGFSTYGEQFRSMHVNQTFTGVVIGRPKQQQSEKQSDHA
jgi:hypothetical protein